MARVKRGAVARKRRRQVLKNTKGARSANSKLFRSAQQHNMKALRYAYVDRRNKKREAKPSNSPSKDPSPAETFCFWF